MRSVFFLFIFTNCALANNNLMVEYFNHFIITFSSHRVSKDDYVSLVSYEVDPAMRVNYDLSPPEQYLNTDNDPDFAIKNINILFSGEGARTFFLNFVRKSILASQKNTQGQLVTYNKGRVTYSFKIEKYQQDNIIISENILALLPDSANASEFSCRYNFKKIEDGTVKLVDIWCAG